jgi:hypothetical protein
MVSSKDVEDSVRLSAINAISKICSRYKEE